MTDDKVIDITPMAKGPRADPEDAFRLYVAGGARSLRKVAHTLNIPEGTVMAWSQRYGWNQRLRDLDTETLQGIAQSVVVATASLSVQALDALRLLLTDPGTPPIVRAQASRIALDQYSRVAHLVPQLLPPAPDNDAADIIEMVQTPEGAHRLLQRTREGVGRR